MSGNDQQEPSLPIGNQTSRSTSDLLPRYYRTDANKKFLSATLDQLTQPGTVKKLNGYIGRQNAKAVKAADIFVTASDQVRQNYQLEPAAVIQDEFESVNFFKDYIDHINQINAFGGDITNHERLNQQELYSWNPHIDWDKFVNFQNYYWLPYGPDVISVVGQQQAIVSTYTVSLVDDDDNYAYVFSPDGMTRNPTITLFRGQTYLFEINSPANPFSFKTTRKTGNTDQYLTGVSASSVTSGTITFTVSMDAPDVIFYVSENDATAGGAIHILDIEENTFLDIDADILGKKTYTTADGVKLSNGMQLTFEGKVNPSNYSTGQWYVEGVGTAIKLIADVDLEIIGSYSDEQELLFDDAPFDQDPFSTASAFPRNKDYITINRASTDRNPWSRYNRWFHQDVIIAAAQSKNQTPEFDQTARANRAIIEFNSGIKLYNFGHKSKQNVDLIDNFTTDVFSTIEGSLGYNIDGIELVDKMRVLFTADTDRLVNGKIFKVNFLNVVIPNRQISFNAQSTVNVTAQTITFDQEHGLSNSDRVTYLNNGNPNIDGLENRKVYYVLVVSATQIKLYNNKIYTVPATIFATGAGTHKFELFSGLRRQINLTEETDATPLENETVLIKQGTTNQGLMYWYNGTIWKLGQVKNTINQAPLFDIFDSAGASYSDTTVYDSSTFIGTKLFSYKVGTGTNDTVLGFPLSYKNINNVGDIVFEFNLLNDSFNYKILSDVKTKNTNIGFLKIISDIDTFKFANGWISSAITNIQPIVRIYKNSGLTNSFPIDVYDNQDQLDDLEVRVYKNGVRVPKDAYTVETGVVRKYVQLLTDVTSADVITLKCFATQSKNNNGYYETPVNLQHNPLNNDLFAFTLGEVIDHVSSIIDNITIFQGAYPGVGNLRDIGDVSAYGTRFLQHSGPLNLALYHFGQKDFNVFKSLEQARLDYGKFKRAFLTAASNSGIQTDTRRHVDHVLEQMTRDNPKTSPYYLSDMFGFLGATQLEYVVVDARIKTYPLTTNFNLTELSNRSVYIYLNDVQLIAGKEYQFGTDIFFEILINLVEGDVIHAFECEKTDGSFCPATPTKLGLYPKYQPKKYIDDTYLTPQEVIQGHDGSITLAYGDYRDDMILELETRIFNNIKIEYDPTIFDIYDFVPGYGRTTAYSKEEFEKVLSVYFYQWTTNINQDYTKQTYWDRLEPFTFNYRSNVAPDGTEVPAFWRGIYKWTLDTDRPHTHPWECLGFSIEPAWWQTVYGPAPYTKDNEILWDDIQLGTIREPGIPTRTVDKFAKGILAYGCPVDEDGNLVAPLYSGFAQGIIPATAAGYYVFGDQGPVETAWRRSSYYAFSLIQTALLLQPNKVLGTCLDRSRIIRNLDNQLVYSDTALRIRLSDIVVPSTVNSTSRVYASGLINYIVDYVSADITVLLDRYKLDLKNLTNKISSKLGGFTSAPKFKLLLDSKSPTSSGGVFVPEDNYKIFLNTSSPIKKLAYSGVIVTKYADGFEIRGYNILEPFFTYYPFRLTERTLRVGGISESFITWAENKTYTAGKTIFYNGQYYRSKITHNSATSFEPDFYARLAELPQTGGREILIRKAWDFNNPQVISYGTKFITIQEVADFIQGYGVYLEQQGFVFEDYNSNLKSVSNWDTALKEFLFWTTQNWAEGAALALSPAAANIVIKSPQSVVNNIRDEFYGYSIYRVDGQLLAPEFANTSRQSNIFTLTPKNTNHGIYGAIFYLVQKEHAIIIDNTTLFNDIIYDLEPGYRQERIKILGYISTAWDGSFDIPGFVFDQALITNWSTWTDYNLGDIVKYKEFYYSAKAFIAGEEQFNSSNWTKLAEKPKAGLLPNWDYKAEQFTDFYDLDTDNFDAAQQRIAQHLIGYQNRQYLENIIKDDVSQYKFYQGMISDKGTQNVLSKLFDTLSADDQDSLTFNEEWAVRVGEYGAVDAFSEIEFKLDETQFKLNPQPIELVSNIDKTVVDFVYRQLPSDVYIKPVGYNNNPWPVAGRKRFLRNAGYVRYEDVKLAVNTIRDAVAYGIEYFDEGDYVWCAFENRDWNVYRFTKNVFTVEDLEYANNELKITCNRLPDLIVGDIIGVDHGGIINGFYVITSIMGRTLFITTTIEGWQAPFADSSEILTYKFESSRITNIDDANDQFPPEFKDNELIWADNNGEGLFTVYANNKVYNRSNLEYTDKSTDLKFGTKVSLTKSGMIAAVSTANNQVFIYNRSTTDTAWLQNQLIVPFDGIADTTNMGFGAETVFSDDGKWLAISSPSASNIRSNWAGDFVSGGQSYAAGDIVQVSNVHFSARTALVSDSSVDRFNQDWNAAYLVTTNADKPGSGYTNQGYVSLYKKIPGNRYIWESSFVSPNPINNERFGSKLAFSKYGDEYVLAISSPGYDSNQGRVYMYRYNITNATWQMDYNRNYVGIYNPLTRYYTGDIVLRAAPPQTPAPDLMLYEEFSFYRCLADQDPTPMETNPSAWEYITGEVSVLGFFPQEIVTSILDNQLIVYPTQDQIIESVQIGDQFGYDVKMSADGTKLVISAPAADHTAYTNYKGKYRTNQRYDVQDVVYYTGAFYAYTTDFDSSVPGVFDPLQWRLLSTGNIINTGKVFVYEYTGTAYTLVDTLGAQNLNIQTAERFGESIAISSSGSYLAVGSVLTDEVKIDQGRVKIFEASTSSFIPHQNLYSTKKENREKFGAHVEFMNDDQTLIVLSTNGDIENFTTFDTATTTFDNISLRIRDLQIDSGRIDIYDRYNTNFIYGESLTTNSSNDLTDKYGYSIAVGKNSLLVSAPYDNDGYADAGSIYSYYKSTNKLSWNALYTEHLIPNTYKIKKAYLYNKVDNQLTTYLDIVDPLQGKIPGPADQEIKFKTYFDPAVYSVGTSSVNVDDGLNWTNTRNGMLWWDLTTAKFMEFAGGEVVYRSATWNKLFQTASIDIYEWVETQYLPSEWDALSGTEEGFAESISGTSKYGDTVYSIKQKYDTVSRTFINTYYYWVKNPSIIPNIAGRLLSASSISTLIADPVGYGYPCVALTGTDSFSLVNVTNILQDKDIILNVQYWLVEDQTRNYHSQWKIISEHPNTIIPAAIESKWIDSLIGKDTNNRLLPDLNLPVKLRYGIESRPRQSMFVNRVEAVKQVIERVNLVLSKELIVDEFNLTNLTLSEDAPSMLTGKWDLQIDLDTELKFIGTAYLQKASLTPIIVDGRIVDAEIVNSGYGYINAPYLTALGTGINAEIRAVLDAAGRVIDVDITNSGTGYDDTTLLSVRPYTVLVDSDSTSFDKWSLYAWDYNSRTWNKTRSQSYDVNSFWNYIDWYVTGYDQFTKVDFVVDNTYQLATLEAHVGSTVKVKNIGTGGWVLLSKYANNVTVDYTQNYTVVGRQNGTIKFDRSLYTFKNTALGYDGPLYDSDKFDNSASEELRIILNTIKDNILVDNLRSEYLNLFFASLRYIFNEQLYVDWAIKTSFVKATHHAGDLTQKVTYNSDNLEDFESYVNEVKPYRTKVREYVSAYRKIDTSASSVTDFDLMPVINNDLEISPVTVNINEQGEVDSLFSELLTYPWKFWYDNIGFTIQSIEIVESGSGYIRAPIVQILGGFGSGAEAKAYISNGRLNRIDLISNGSGYLKAPTILIDGGLSETGIAATAVAIIDNSLVRSNKITVKFDRITRAYYITELEETETFTGTGSRVQFALAFSPNAIIGKSTVTVDGVDVLRDDYTLTSKKSTSKGFTSYSGLLSFDVAPTVGADIVITYQKDFKHLSAADRINFYYNPQTGQLGKDLAQLMTGIDFGGVNITGLGFTANGGWDSLPWYSEGWDGFDAAFDDYIAIVGDSTYAFTLPYLPALNEEINVYINGQRIDDPYYDVYDGVTTQPNGRKIAPVGTYMQTWIGDGISQTIELPNLTSSPPLDINSGDKVIFRRSTSDGSFAPDENSYDTQLSGGNLAYSTATGFAPDDIILDGEGFITAAHSHAPEEIVPGHISDTVAIKLFRLPSSGSSVIYFKNYICNGVTTEFDVGQFPSSSAGIFVKLDNLVLEQNLDYTIDWAAKKINMTVVPADKKILNVISFSNSSNYILDVDYFVSDGSTVEYVTNAPWPTLATDLTAQQAIDRLGTTVLINGDPAIYEIFETDTTYAAPNRVGIRLGEAPLVDSVINFIITGDANQTISVVRSQPLDTDGSSTSYVLTNTIGMSLPYANNVLVIKNGLLLTPGDSTNYTLSEYQLTYDIPVYKALPFTLDPADIKVFIEGVQLLSVDYVLDVAALTITLNSTKYQEGAQMTVVNFTDADYIINNNAITFDTLLLILDTVEVISFYNHDSQKIVRSAERFDITTTLVSGSLSYFKFMDMKGGVIPLHRTVKSDEYIWVAKNKQLLSHSIDFILEDDHRTIKFADTINAADKFDIILFGDAPITAGYGYMQFKDMLNRVHYKRISKAKSTVLSINLGQKDATITVNDGTVLTAPNKTKNLPGVIEINGERIEYFIKTGNILSQLRRGTLGTGVPTTHVAGNYVLDIGPTETIPYTDQHIVETFISDGSSRILPLNYVPTVGVTDWYTDTIPLGYGKSNELDVFVGGYRLKKTDYSKFDQANNYPESPEGDSQVEAEFAVNGSAGVRLTAETAINSKIVVIKKIGKVWEDSADQVEIFRDSSVPYGAATFDVFKNNTVYTLSLKLSGSGYAIGNVLVIPGLFVGGTSPANDIVITVTGITLDSTAAITSYTYTGVGQDNGFTAKSLVQSDNLIANFIKNTEAVWPIYK